MQDSVCLIRTLPRSNSPCVRPPARSTLLTTTIFFRRLSFRQGMSLAWTMWTRVAEATVWEQRRLFSLEDREAIDRADRGAALSRRRSRGVEERNPLTNKNSTTKKTLSSNKPTITIMIRTYIHFTCVFIWFLLYYNCGDGVRYREVCSSWSYSS